MCDGRLNVKVRITNHMLMNGFVPRNMCHCLDKKGFMDFLTLKCVFLCRESEGKTT